MSNLSTLLEQSHRPQLVADVVTLADNTISEQSGLTGMALKGAVGAGKKKDPEIVTKGVNRALPDILGDLEPLWQEYQNSETKDFSDFVTGRSAQIADIIMKNADKHAEKINVPAIAKAYSALRGKAAGIIEAKIPALAQVIENHMKSLGA